MLLSHDENERPDCTQALKYLEGIHKKYKIQHQNVSPFQQNGELDQTKNSLNNLPKFLQPENEIISLTLDESRTEDRANEQQINPQDLSKDQRKNQKSSSKNTKITNTTKPQLSKPSYSSSQKNLGTISKFQYSASSKPIKASLAPTKSSIGIFRSERPSTQAKNSTQQPNANRTPQKPTHVYSTQKVQRDSFKRSDPTLLLDKMKPSKPVHSTGYPANKNHVINSLTQGNNNPKVYIQNPIEANKATNQLGLSQIEEVINKKTSSKGLDSERFSVTQKVIHPANLLSVAKGPQQSFAPGQKSSAFSSAFQNTIRGFGLNESKIQAFKPVQISDKTRKTTISGDAHPNPGLGKVATPFSTQKVSTNVNSPKKPSSSVQGNLQPKNEQTIANPKSFSIQENKANIGFHQQAAKLSSSQHQNLTYRNNASKLATARSDASIPVKIYPNQAKVTQLTYTSQLSHQAKLKKFQNIKNAAGSSKKNQSCQLPKAAHRSPENHPRKPDDFLNASKSESQLTQNAQKEHHQLIAQGSVNSLAPFAPKIEQLPSKPEQINQLFANSKSIDASRQNTARESLSGSVLDFGKKSGSPEHVYRSASIQNEYEQAAFSKKSSQGLYFKNTYHQGNQELQLAATQSIPQHLRQTSSIVNTHSNFQIAQDQMAGEPMMMKKFQQNAELAFGSIPPGGKNYGYEEYYGNDCITVSVKEDVLSQGLLDFSIRSPNYDLNSKVSETESILDRVNNVALSTSKIGSVYDLLNQIKSDEKPRNFGSSKPDQHNTLAEQMKRYRSHENLRSEGANISQFQRSDKSEENHRTSNLAGFNFGFGQQGNVLEDGENLSGHGTLMGSYVYADKKSCGSNILSSRGNCSRQISEVNSQQILALENQFARTTDDFSTVRNLARDSFANTTQVEDPFRNTLQKQQINQEGIYWSHHIDFENLETESKNLNKILQNSKVAKKTKKSNLSLTNNNLLWHNTKSTLPERFNSLVPGAHSTLYDRGSLDSRPNLQRNKISTNSVVQKSVKQQKGQKIGSNRMTSAQGPSHKNSKADAIQNSQQVKTLSTQKEPELQVLSNPPEKKVDNFIGQPKPKVKNLTISPYVKPIKIPVKLGNLEIKENKSIYLSCNSNKSDQFTICVRQDGLEIKIRSLYNGITNSCTLFDLPEKYVKYYNYMRKVAEALNEKADQKRLNKQKIPGNQANNPSNSQRDMLADGSGENYQKDLSLRSTTCELVQNVARFAPRQALVIIKYQQGP